MKITDITTELVQLPFRESLVAAYGERTHSTIVLVEVRTDEGLVGYGESTGLFQHTAETIIQTELKPLLLGEDPLRIEYLVHKLEHLIDWNSFAAYPIAAIDVALHDLKGKALGVPVYELLGGLYRSEVQFDGLIHLHDAHTDAESARRYVELGYRTLKVKTGADIALDVERLRAIRDTVGSVPRIRLDYNMALTPHSALHSLDALAGFAIEYVEQPTPGWDLEGLRHIARSSPIPVAADESCQSPRDAARLAELHACEVFCVYLSESGGLTRAREISAIANTAGIHCVLGTWGEGGIGFSAGVHLAASSRNFSLDQGTGYQVLAHDYVDCPFPIDEHGGRVVVPSRPGLGILPDRDAIRERCQVEQNDAVFRASREGIPRLGQLVAPVR